MLYLGISNLVSGKAVSKCGWKWHGLDRMITMIGFWSRLKPERRIRSGSEGKGEAGTKRPGSRLTVAQSLLASFCSPKEWHFPQMQGSRLQPVDSGRERLVCWNGRGWHLCESLGASRQEWCQRLCRRQSSPCQLQASQQLFPSRTRLTKTGTRIFANRNSHSGCLVCRPATCFCSARTKASTTHVVVRNHKSSSNSSNNR